VEEAQEKQILKQQLVNIQKRTSDQVIQYDNFQEDYRKLNGRVEKIESYLLGEGQKQKDATTDIETRLGALENKVRMLEASVVDQDTKFQQSIASLRQEVAGDLRKISSSLTSTPSSPKSSGGSKGAFARAEAHFAKKEWRNAILNYEKYRSANPKGNSYAAATYKIGVCFEELGMSTEAEAFYSEVLEKYPKDKIAKSAGFRLNKLQESHKKKNR
jgi:TolA-binding protein